MNSNKLVFLALGSFVLFIVLLMGLFLGLNRRDALEDYPVLGDELVPELYPVPEFAFFDSNEDVVALDDLKGKIWVANLFFTSCAGPCPVMMNEVAKLVPNYPQDSNVHFVSISVDPDTDTSAHLANYAKRFKVNTETWHFLTGPIEQVNTLSYDGFKVGSVDDPVIHSTKFILVDTRGIIRGYFDGFGDSAAEGIADLQMAIAALQKESPV